MKGNTTFGKLDNVVPRQASECCEVTTCWLTLESLYVGVCVGQAVLHDILVATRHVCKLLLW